MVRGPSGAKSTLSKEVEQFRRAQEISSIPPEDAHVRKTVAKYLGWGDPETVLREGEAAKKVINEVMSKEIARLDQREAAVHGDAVKIQLELERQGVLQPRLLGPKGTLPGVVVRDPAGGNRARRRTPQPSGGGIRYVYRQLSATDRVAIDAGQGLTPKGIGGTIAQQVAGKDTQYISASLTEGATGLFASGNGLARIDVKAAVAGGATFVDHADVAGAVRRLGTPTDVRNATRAQEVLFMRTIPRNAVRIIRSK
jgi:hypothetical protein